MKNELLSTASSRKLEQDEQSASSTDIESEEEGGLRRSRRIAKAEKVLERASYFEEPEPGYRFIHMDSVRRLFEEGHKCKDAKIELQEDQVKRYGQRALFSLQCSSCKK